jgi:hypothetical protein
LGLCSVGAFVGHPACLPGETVSSVSLQARRGAAGRRPASEGALLECSIDSCRVWVRCVMARARETVCSLQCASPFQSTVQCDSKIRNIP